MLYRLLKDMGNILRLRFAAAEEYRYNPIVFIAVLLLLGMINAAALTPLFGNSAGAVAFAITLTVVKWWVLSGAMRVLLHYYGAPKLPLYGYTLASEALAAPTLLIFYFPEAASVGLFWQIWTFWTQFSGFMKLGNTSGWKVILGYLVYFVGTLIVGSLCMLAFTQTGLLDLDSVNQRLQEVMQHKK